MANNKSSHSPETMAASPEEEGGAAVAGDDLDDLPFQCCVCLDLLYKPIVLACGHISCFWCVHKAMHVLRESHCAVCRQPYHHFPSICQLLHHLLLKLEPVDYKRREKEVLEEERRVDTYSPQFIDFAIPKNNNCEIGKSEEKKLEASKNRVPQEGLPNSSITDGHLEKVVVEDVLCPICKELLYQPAVLNCGHVYCISCLSCLDTKELKCQVCESFHPGEFPNVCLDLNHFLEEYFPVEYALRREKVQLKKSQYHTGESSLGTSSMEESNSTPCKKKDTLLQGMNEDWSNVHIGVGCDACGMYPIRGKRYKCKDCTEAIGFDLCEACYNTRSKLPGRFNQQHTPDHRMELDDSNILSRILRFRAIPEEALEEVVIEEAFIAPDGLVPIPDDLEGEENGEEGELL